MCEATSIAYGIAAIVGAGMSYYGAQQQSTEYKRAQQEQNAYAAAQQQLAMTQREEDRKISDAKQNSVLEEAAAVAPTRANEIKQSEDKQTASNVDALQQANLLGEDSVAATASGNQSNEYLKARSDAAAQQTEQAIKLARLFGAQTAGQDAVANQMMGAIDHRLNQQALDAARGSMHKGFEWMFDDLSVRQDRARSNYDPNKGVGTQALGGGLMNIGMDGLGTAYGSAAANGGGMSPQAGKAQKSGSYFKVKG